MRFSWCWTVKSIVLCQMSTSWHDLRAIDGNIFPWFFLCTHLLNQFPLFLLLGGSEIGFDVTLTEWIRVGNVSKCLPRLNEELSPFSLIADTEPDHEWTRPVIADLANTFDLGGFDVHHQCIDDFNHFVFIVFHSPFEVHDRGFCYPEDDDVVALILPPICLSDFFSNNILKRLSIALCCGSRGL